MLVVTRIHKMASSNFASIASLVSFIDSCRSYADHVLVCIGAVTIEESEKYVLDAESSFTENKYSSFVTIKCIHPWGHFVSSLNASILFASSNGYEKIAFQVRQFF